MEILVRAVMKEDVDESEESPAVAQTDPGVAQKANPGASLDLEADRAPKADLLVALVVLEVVPDLDPGKLEFINFLFCSECTFVTKTLNNLRDN